MKKILKIPALELKDAPSMLRHGCREGNFALVKKAFIMDKDVNIHEDQEYALRWACTHGHLDIVQFLLESEEIKNHAIFYQPQKKADELINISFLWAAQSGNLELVKYLVGYAIKHELYQYISHPSYLLRTFSHTVKKGAEKRKRQEDNDKYDDFNVSVIFYLLKEIPEFPVLPQKSESFYDLMEISSLPLIQFVLECPVFEPFLNMDKLSFGCYRAIIADNYEVADFLAQQNKIRIDFAQSNEEILWRAFRMNVTQLEFVLNHPLLKHQVSFKDNTYWAGRLSNPLGVKKEDYEAFEFMAVSKKIDQHIDFSSHDFKGFRALLNTGDIKAFNIFIKHKTLWNNWDFYHWIKKNCSHTTINVFEHYFITKRYKELKKNLPVKNHLVKKQLKI